MATVGVAVGAPYEVLGDLAREVEERGYDTIWVFDGRRDALIQAAVLAQATSRIRIGTDTALGLSRSPTLAAQQAWDVNELSGGRFTLGLGIDKPTPVRERHGLPTGQVNTRMREYLDAVTVVWDQYQGTPSVLMGRHYNIVRPGPAGLGFAAGQDRPRLELAAEFIDQARIAAERADGLLGTAFTSMAYLEDRLLPEIAETLGAQGRSRSDFTVRQSALVSVADDRAEAVRRAKEQLAWFARTDTGADVFTSSHDTQLLELLSDTEEGEHDPQQVVTDAMVAEYTVTGTPGEVREQLGALGELVDHLVIASPWVGVSPRQQAEAFMAMVDACAPEPPRS